MTTEHWRTPQEVSAAIAAERRTAIRTALAHIRAGRKDRALGTMLVTTWSQAVMAGCYDEPERETCPGALGVAHG